MTDYSPERDGRATTRPDGDPPLEGRMCRVREALRDRENPVTVGVLADAVRRREREESARATQPRADVHEDLVTRVLPSMQAAGKVTFDEHRGTVSAARPLRTRIGGVAAALTTRTAASVVAVGVLAALAVVPLGGVDPAAMLGAGGTAALGGRVLAWLVA